MHALTLEIVVGPDATSTAAHSAVLTAVSVGRRTFIGGVRVIGALDQALHSSLPEAAAYEALEAEIGRCGTAEIAGASVAAPHVSALTAAIAVSRLIAVTSGCECPPSEVGRTSAMSTRRLAPALKIDAWGGSHAGRPTN